MFPGSIPPPERIEVATEIERRFHTSLRQLKQERKLSPDHYDLCFTTFLNAKQEALYFLSVRDDKLEQERELDKAIKRSQRRKLPLWLKVIYIAFYAGMIVVSLTQPLPWIGGIVLLFVVGVSTVLLFTYL